MAFNYELNCATQRIAGVVVTSGKGKISKEEKELIEKDSWGKELISNKVLTITSEPVKKEKKKRKEKEQAFENEIEIDE